MNFKLASNMCCKFLVLGSLTALLSIGLPAFAHPFSSLPQQGQQSAQPSAVSGKVVSIADEKKSFSLEVNSDGNANTMQFVLDQNTQPLLEHPPERYPQPPPSPLLSVRLHRYR